MPWDKDNVPSAAKNLSDKEKEVFVRVANKMLRDGEDEEDAIKAGLSQAQKTEKSFATAIAEVIEKYFGGSNEAHKPEPEGDETHASVAKSVDTEKREFTAVVLRPDVPDLHGDIYGPDVVADAAHNYMQFCQKSNLQHLVQTEHASVVESYVSPADFDLGEGKVLKGDWVMTMKIHSDELWEKCKDGTFTGFSVGCMAVTEKIDD